LNRSQTNKNEQKQTKTSKNKQKHTNQNKQKQTKDNQKTTKNNQNNGIAQSPNQLTSPSSAEVLLVRLNPVGARLTRTTKTAEFPSFRKAFLRG
jgi:hypothetical protein